MSHEKIVAVYDTAAHAEAAVNTLRSAGYPASDISVIRREGSATDSTLSELGFWQRLFGSDIGLRDAQIYGQTVRQGGAVVAVRVLESDAANVIDLLDAHKPMDLVDRARATAFTQTPKVMVPPPTSSMTPSHILDKDEEVVRLAEEQLDVGKRKVESGKTRVRRYVVERPVEANVTLHEEHVEVMRRAIAEPGYTKDIDWSEQVVEVSETAERPVVNKTLRVTEEVVIRKKGSDHIETIHDTVRRQQLDIEKVPLETVKK